MITRHRDVTPVYRRKPDCPRDLGYWYCQECIAEWKESLQGERTDRAHPWGCGRIQFSKRCGHTHLGYEWCDSCKANGNAQRGQATPHGEYEVAKVVTGMWMEYRE